jgi:excinuclease ABC subunit C
MWAVQDTLQTLRKAFPYLTCNREITGKDERACLFYDIKLCNGPCIGAVNREQYRAMIEELMSVLTGQSDGVLKRLNVEMEGAAEALNFEMAASIRDQIRAIDLITKKNRAVGKQFTDHDVIALARDNNDAVVQILFVRSGILIGSSSHVLDGTEGESDEDVIETFIKRFYADAPEVPKDLILPQDVEEAKIIEQWLRDKRGGSKVSITVPQRGQKRELVQMAQDNASEALRMMRAQWEADTTKQEQAIRHQHDTGHGYRRQSGCVCAGNAA